MDQIDVIIVEKEGGPFITEKMTMQEYWYIRTHNPYNFCAIQILDYNDPTKIALWDLILEKLKANGKYEGSCVRIITPPDITTQIKKENM
jgi:hypothetical protein